MTSLEDPFNIFALEVNKKGKISFWILNSQLEFGKQNNHSKETINIIANHYRFLATININKALNIFSLLISIDCGEQLIYNICGFHQPLNKPPFLDLNTKTTI